MDKLKKAIELLTRTSSLPELENNSWDKTLLEDIQDFLEEDNDEELMTEETLIEYIISSGSVPSKGTDFLSREEILKIEQYASSHSDDDLEDFIRKILKRKGE